jgi:hypothetical protein
LQFTVDRLVWNQLLVGRIFSSAFAGVQVLNSVFSLIHRLTVALRKLALHCRSSSKRKVVLTLQGRIQFPPCTPCSPCEPYSPRDSSMKRHFDRPDCPRIQGQKKSSHGVHGGRGGLQFTVWRTPFAVDRRQRGLANESPKEFFE